MRYLALTKQDREDMLKAIGVKKVDDLYDAVPDQFLLKNPIAELPNHQGEIEVENIMKNFAKKNRSASEGSFFLGAGCYKHHIPATVDHLIQRSEFLTSYTPYQPEISQGTLAVIFQFQSIISLLTGMQVANASMYDGATSLAEACLMSLRLKNTKKKIAIHGNIHPDYLEVCKTFLDLNQAKLVDKIDDSCSAVVVQYPDFYGNIIDLNEVRKKCDEAGALMIVVVNEILALGLLEAPSQADIVVGEASSLGVGLNFGGPLLGFFACKKEFVRQMPGRICGATIDADGKHGYVLTLNAREQHIRRDKATSNICSNQGLCATAFTIHTSLLGEIGFKKLAQINHHRAGFAFDELSKVKGLKVLNENFFNEFTIEFTKNAQEINHKLLAKNIIGGYCVDNKMILAFSELTSEEEIKNLAKNLGEIL
ncbi:putative glycine dehydrogenase (decarboxylating) subunit 1 [Alphaproteobacteria bacterium]|nr:putative glycine dehydrogenase (decarboxylating) subunit 1 [Alphaproteobacteria bacterium]